LSGLTLHLGVMVVSYRTATKKVGALTTGDVAQILESKYGILAAYARVHGKDIADALAGSMRTALEAKIMGAPSVDPFGSGTQKIQQGMKDFILTKEVEKVGLPGVPTQAALNGVNHRLKHPYAKKNSRRPSFRDTGTMVGAYRAWVSGQ
jgi:hypothetical protein